MLERFEDPRRAGLLALEGAVELIAAQEAVCLERLERLELSMQDVPPNDFDYWVFDFRRRQIQAILDWLAACRSDELATI